MGMRRTDLTYLQQCFQDKSMPELQSIRMCELGNQAIRSGGAYYEYHGKLAKMAKFGEGEYTKVSKVYFTALGIQHTSIDINGKSDSLVYDLMQQITDSHLLNSFDIVTNYGTSEHIADYEEAQRTGELVTEQYPCFLNIHNLCKKNGIFVHCVPCVGHWPGHGLCHYFPQFFRQLADLCDYEMLLDMIDHKWQVRVSMRKLSDKPFISESAFDSCLQHVTTGWNDPFIKNTPLSGLREAPKSITRGR